MTLRQKRKPKNQRRNYYDALNLFFSIDKTQVYIFEKYTKNLRILPQQTNDERSSKLREHFRFFAISIFLSAFLEPEKGRTSRKVVKLILYFSEKQGTVNVLKKAKFVIHSYRDGLFEEGTPRAPTRKVTDNPCWAFKL